MKLVILDPSVNNVGYAVFNMLAFKRRRAWKWGTFKLEGHNLEMRIIDLIQKMDETIGEFQFLSTERPAFFSSERGAIAAHMNYTIDLAAVAYYVAGHYRMDHRHHFAITANQWKGSVDKLITARRFFKLWPKIAPDSLSEHAIDAVMLGRFCIQNFLVHSAVVKAEMKKPERMLELI